MPPRKMADLTIHSLPTKRPSPSKEASHSATLSGLPRVGRGAPDSGTGAAAASAASTSAAVGVLSGASSPAEEAFEYSAVSCGGDITALATSLSASEEAAAAIGATAGREATGAGEAAAETSPNPWAAVTEAPGAAETTLAQLAACFASAGFRTFSSNSARTEDFSRSQSGLPSGVSPLLSSSQSSRASCMYWASRGASRFRTATISGAGHSTCGFGFGLGLGLTIGFAFGFGLTAGLGLGFGFSEGGPFGMFLGCPDQVHPR
mmetsp:Transcript_2795/g.8372  ORF Transcript_2795/g.8372 Transcript_2795/m.8372 type:complete len:263 (+) Transcript_2795:1065-1853(+)